MKLNYKHKIQLGLKIYFLKVSRSPHVKFAGMVYAAERQFLKDGVIWNKGTFRRLRARTRAPRSIMSVEEEEEEQQDDDNDDDDE